MLLPKTWLKKRHASNKNFFVKISDDREFKIAELKDIVGIKNKLNVDEYLTWGIYYLWNVLGGMFEVCR